jgi:tetratricopeptide (TPR) repeat protein
MMKPLRIQVLSLCLVLLWTSSQLSSHAFEKVTEEQLQKAQLIFEEARALMSRANLEKNQEKRLALYRRISRSDEFNVSIDETSTPVIRHPSRTRMNAYIRFSRWTRNIFTFAKLQLEAPHCFVKPTSFCILQLLAKNSYKNSGQRSGERYPRYIDLVTELARMGKGISVLDIVSTLEPAQTPWFDVVYATILFEEKKVNANYFLDRSIQRVDLLWPSNRPYIWSQVAKAYMVAGKPQLAVNAIEKAVISAKTLKSKETAAWRMAVVAHTTIEQDIGDTFFKLSVLRSTRKAIDRVSRTYRFISDRELSRTVGIYVGKRIATDNFSISDATKLIDDLSPNGRFDSWRQVFMTLINSDKASQVENILGDPPKELRSLQRGTLLLTALTKMKKFDEALALIRQIRDPSERVNAYFHIFFAQLTQHNDVEAARQTMRRLDMFLPPLSGKVERFSEGHSLTIWKGVTTGSRALADLRRAEMFALLGEPEKGREALTRALKWLKHGHNKRSSLTLTYIPRDRWLSPLQSALISISQSLRSQHKTALFEVARNAGAFMKLEQSPGLGGVARNGYFRQIAAVAILVNRPRDANIAISELVFSEQNLIEELIGLVKSLNSISSSAVSYPNEP